MIKPVAHIIKKKKKSSAFVAYAFGVWLGMQYVVSVASNILSKSGDQIAGEGSNKTLMASALLWPYIYFIFLPKNKNGTKLRRSAVIALIVFLGFSFISAFVSPVPMSSATFVVLTLLTIFIAKKFNSILHPRDLELGLKIYAIIILSLLVGFAIYDYQPGIRLGNGKNILNPNSIGVVCISAGLSVMAFRNKAIRYALLGAVLVVAYLTKSRASTIGLVIGIAVIAYHRIKSDSGYGKYASLGCLVLSLCAAGIYWDEVWIFVADFLELHSQYRGIGSGASGRVDVWMDVWDLFLDNPVIGVGFRSHEYILGGSAHNGYLATLAEIGIFGFIALIYLMLVGVLLLWRRVGQSKYNYTDSILLGLCVGYMFLGIFERYLVNIGNPTSLLFVVSILAPNTVSYRATQPTLRSYLRSDSTVIKT